MIITLFQIFGLLGLVIFIPIYAEPVVNDENLRVEKYVVGICCGVTTIDFIDDDLLVLQKQDGRVRLIQDGILQKDDVFDANVTSIGEQGMLGIAVADNNTVYLYFTESPEDGGIALGKRIYKYDWNGTNLINPILIHDFKETQTYHNGGAMVEGLDGTVYLIIGDAGRYGKYQNHNTNLVYETGIIYRVDPPGPFYAIGIRNSFGLAIDPITGNLWDTENGDDNFDEINLVPPNFNSGWDVQMGPTHTNSTELPPNGSYVYQDPQFSWEQPVAPTGITMIDSQPFEDYKNSFFVGDCNNGTLYKFELDKNRTGFVFDSKDLTDKVANIGDSIHEIVFGTGFGCITDVTSGPDGFLYVASMSDGAIYRILPKAMALDSETRNSKTLILTCSLF